MSGDQGKSTTKKKLRMGYSLVVKCLPCMYKALAVISSERKTGGIKRQWEGRRGREGGKEGKDSEGYILN